MINKSTGNLKKLIESLLKEYTGAMGAKDTSFYPKNNKGPVGGMFTNMLGPNTSWPLLAPWGSVVSSYLEEISLNKQDHSLLAAKQKHLEKKSQLTPERVKLLGNMLNVNWDKVDINEFAEGLWVELEHGLLIPRLNVTNDNLVQTAKIALSHLIEDPQYYTKLKKYVENKKNKIEVPENGQCNFNCGTILEKKFLDFKKFKAAPHNEKHVILGLENPPVLGTGSSRQAFLVDSNSVLKMAINKKGLAQNKAELDLFTNPKMNGIVNKIFDYDPQYRWLLVEVVKEVGAIEFKKITKVDWRVFKEMIKDLNEKFMPINAVNSNFVKMVYAAMQTGNLELGDIIVLNHWGKTVDGRIVLLDYGYTTDVRKKHYSGGEYGKSDSPTITGYNSATKPILEV